MRAMRASYGLAGLALGALLLSQGPVLADAKQIADSLVAAAAATGRVQASYEAAADEAGAVAITNFKVVRSDAQTILIPRVVVTGATPRTEGGFTATSIAFDNGTATHGKDTVAWKTGLIENAIVPSAEEVKAESDIRAFGKLGVTEISISESNLAEPVTIADVDVVLQADADGTTNAFASQITGVHFSSSALSGRPQEKAVIDALGYETFDVNIAAAGTFDKANERMSLSSLTINTANVGTLTIKANVTNVSPGKIVTHTEDAADTSPTLENVEVRFDNAGVVERALDMHAALIWGTREDAAAQVKAALPLVLHFVGNEAFQAQMKTAVSTFIDEPKSIVFTARPNPPIPVGKVVGTALGQPGNLPDLLGANISAN